MVATALHVHIHCSWVLSDYYHKQTSQTANNIGIAKIDFIDAAFGEAKWH